jgi:cobalamin biosynthesis Mg chelatase CobN
VRRILLVVILATVLVLTYATVALAATPTQVYNYYHQHGTMSPSFTAADLRRYLGDAHIHQYGDPHVLAKADAAARAALAAMSTTTTAQVTSTLPQTSTTTTALLTSTSAVSSTTLQGQASTTTMAPLTSTSAMSSTTSPAPTTTAEPAKGAAVGSSIWWVYVLIGIVVAAVLAGGGYALVRSRSGSTGTKV